MGRQGHQHEAEMKYALAVIVLLLASPVSAQDPSLVRAQQLGNRYNECVYFSAVERLNQNSGDISAAAEAAFASCATEARQMASFLKNRGATDAQIAEALAEKNAGIKAELRKIHNEARGIKP